MPAGRCRGGPRREQRVRTTDRRWPGLSRRSDAVRRVASACLLGAAAALAWGQESAASAPRAAASAPISISDVVAEAEAATSSLREIASSAAPEPASEAVRRDLPALVQEINARLEETARTVEGSTSLERLRLFEADWRTLTGALPAWRAVLTARARKLEDDLARLDELAARWRQALAPPDTGAAPPEVRSRAEAILREAADARRRITAEQSRVVALLGRVAEQQARVDEAVKTIAARRDALVGQLLVQDGPTLWSPELRAETGDRRDIRASLAAAAEGLRAFLDRNRGRLVAHGAVFLALAGALVWLRRWARPVVAADPSLERAATVFRLPIATALVLAILFNDRIYPQTPQVLAAIFGAVALLPTALILRRLFTPDFHPFLHAIVVLFLVDQLRAVAEGAPAVSRPLFFVEATGAFLFFLWLRRTRVQPVLRRGALAVLPFFAVSAAANALGYVNLARIVGGGVLRSLYAAVVLYALYRIADALAAFALRLPPLGWLHMALRHAPAIRARLRTGFGVAAVALWALAALESFSVREPALGLARDLLTSELHVGSLALSAGDVLAFLIVVWLAFALSRLVRFALEEDVFPRVALARGVPYAISTIVDYAILLIGFFLAASAAGLDLTRLTVLVGAFGVGIGFGLQNVFNNFVSGLILLFERPIEVGDEIRIGDAGGVVRRIGIRASRIRQWDGAEVIVPNSRLISENVKNWTLSARLRGIEIPVNVDQAVDTAGVVASLLEVARANPLVAAEPAPQVLLGDIAPPPTLAYRLRVWTAEADQATRLTSELAIAIRDRLQADRTASGTSRP